MSLKNIKHDGVYYNPRLVVKDVIVPSLKNSNKLNIIAGYFTVDSLLEISEGLETFLNSSGKINLILGIPQKGLDSTNKGMVEALKIAEESNLSSEIVEDFEELLSSNVESLNSELQKDKIRILAYLIKENLLNIKFAVKERGMVHAKTYIFEDDEINRLVVSGSMNPTGQGLTDNTDNNNIDTSWENSLKTDSHSRYFINLWTNKIPDTNVLDATHELADRLLSKVGEKDIGEVLKNLSTSKTLSSIYEDILNSPVWLEYTVSKSALYPHQINAFQEGISSWPMRNLFADEVGLGKTLEVGACVAYAIKHLNVKRILILAPKSVVNQWQSELYIHFGLDNFFVKPKNKNYFQDKQGNQIVIEDQSTYSKEFPNFLILSKDLATKHNFQNIFDKSNEYPDMLIVDEAHHARGQKNEKGIFKPTQFRYMLENIIQNIPHVLFASATPMRKSYMEYYYLLQLLGIDKILSEKDYDLTLVDLGRDAIKIDPIIFGKIFKILNETIKFLKQAPSYLNHEQENLFNEIKENIINDSNLLEYLHLQPVILDLLIRIHPTTLFTTRHFRESLIEYDTYVFPERNFSNEEIDEDEMSENLSILFTKLVSYAENYYLKTESAFGKFTSRKLGVASFKESFVSSYSAAKSRLVNRKNKLEKEFLEKYKNEDMENDSIVFQDDFDTDDESNIEIEVGLDFDINVVLEYAKQEIIEINSMLELCSLIEEEEKEKLTPDPKMSKLITILKNNFENNDRKPVLVFSKYLSTLDEAVRLVSKNLIDQVEGIGVYKGGGKIEVKYGDLDWINSNREDIKTDLEEGNIEIVFCSTAAQEGVNLQAAATLINLDVPWIPSDLEQRIGRIARLGQQEPVVNIYNLWYPNSYEAKIYKRLLERKDLLEVALGKFPEVVSDAIKNQTYGNSEIIDIDSVIEKLSSLKSEVSTVALSKLWSSNNNAIEPFSNLFRKKLIQNFSVFDESIKKYTEFPGDRDSISLRKSEVSSIFTSLSISEKGNTNLYSLKANNLLLGFYVDLDGKKMIVNPYYLPDLVNGLLSENSVSLEYLIEYKNQNNIELLREYKKLLKEWLIPLHNEFNPLDSFLYEENIQVLESEHIGSINILKS